jgi:HEAT repeat protein
MKTNRICFLMFLFGVFTIFSNVSNFSNIVPVLAQEDEASQIAVLQKIDLSKAAEPELFEAATACRRLTVIGTEKSVDVLKPLLADSRLASYARTALENIGGTTAQTILRENPAQADNASPKNEKHQNALVSLQTILQGDEKGLKLFSELLKSDDKILFHTALTAFRKFSDRKIVDVLAQEQTLLKPEHRIAAILSLLDRNDVAPVPQQIIETAESEPNDEIRAAAISVLGAFPDENVIQILFSTLQDSSNSETILSAAFEALTTTRYAEIDKKIIELLTVNIMLESRGGDDPALQIAVCRLSGERHLTKAEPLLWKAATNSQHDGVRNSAFAALGRVINQDGFAKLLETYRKYANENENEIETLKSSILTGIKTACQQASDRNGYAKLVTEKLPESISLQLELLATIGGSESLIRIAETAKTTEHDAIRDSATKYLGEWTGAEAAPVLLDLSVSLKEEKYKVRTFRGFLRAVRQFDLPKEEKRKLCEKALAAAPRNEEKKLVQDILSKL